MSQYLTILYEYQHTCTKAQTLSWRMDQLCNKPVTHCYIIIIQTHIRTCSELPMQNKQGCLWLWQGCHNLVYKQQPLNKVVERLYFAVHIVYIVDTTLSVDVQTKHACHEVVWLACHNIVIIPCHCKQQKVSWDDHSEPANVTSISYLSALNMYNLL